MGHMQRIRKNLRSTRREIPLYLQNLETEGINIEPKKVWGGISHGPRNAKNERKNIHRLNWSIPSDLSKRKQTAIHSLQL